MAVMTSSSFAKLLWPGLNEIYGKTYNEYPVEWDKLGFEKNTSDRAYEEDLGYSSFGLAQFKSEGSSVAYDSERQGFTTRYTHLTYGLGFIITREMYEDDLMVKPKTIKTFATFYDYMILKHEQEYKSNKQFIKFLK